MPPCPTNPYGASKLAIDHMLTAEAQAIRATEELGPFGDYLVADGQYVAGEIRRRKGDYKAAEAAFRRAHQLGRDPQPGLALLFLAQGDAERAAAALRVAVKAGSGTPLPASWRR